MPTVVRTLTPADVPSAMELSKAANWNQTPEDWLRVLQLAGEGFRCVEAAGKIVATASLLPYGTRLAWIVQPQEHSVHVYHGSRSDKVLYVADSLDGEDILSGFKLPLARIFP